MVVTLALAASAVADASHDTSRNTVASDAHARLGIGLGGLVLTGARPAAAAIRNHQHHRLVRLDDLVFQSRNNSL